MSLLLHMFAFFLDKLTPFRSRDFAGDKHLDALRGVLNLDPLVRSDFLFVLILLRVPSSPPKPSTSIIVIEGCSLAWF